MTPRKQFRIDSSIFALYIGRKSGTARVTLDELGGNDDWETMEDYAQELNGLVRGLSFDSALDVVFEEIES